ncbi:MAG: 16S rRNA (cytidine(1402)-2'-O)-methyltransferase, partial [Myxococcales bacterium]|nr:16S rRNA (cytidine(1402)-2'-O)-methyltransferase [Myxococcales bacterium]
MPLYLVATPLGHLGDVSQRVRETLQAADIIAAEDTRRTASLLQLLDLPSTTLRSYYDQNEVQRTPELISALQSGLNVALVSDAGTPSVSDPGLVLVREAIREGLPIVPVPGPS